MRLFARTSLLRAAFSAAWLVSAPASSKDLPLEKQVIVVVGMPGSGKSMWAKEIADVIGAPAPLSSGDLIREEVKRRGLEYTPANESAVATEMARRPGALGRLMTARVAAQPGPAVVVEGFRSIYDVSGLNAAKRFHVTIVATVAPARVRYKRMLDRDSESDRYASIDLAQHQAYLRQRDESELARGVGVLIQRADFRLETHRSEGLTRPLVRAMARNFSGGAGSLTEAFDRAAKVLPQAEVEAMSRNPYVGPYLEDTLHALAKMGNRPGALALVRRLGRSRAVGDARGAAYEAWAAHSFGSRTAAVAIEHEGNEVDVLLRDGRAVEAKSGAPDSDAIKQLRARAQTGNPVVLVSGRRPDRRFLSWFRKNGRTELPRGYELIHLPMGGSPRRILSSASRIQSASPHSRSIARAAR